MSARPRCPHCGSIMRRWATPPGSSWETPFLWVCFSDECDYYVRGWTWLEEHFGRKASYRHSLDPATGAAGPLPVWSAAALRQGILPDKDGDHDE